MKITDDVFVLIKSMSKTEKAYFKKFSSIHTLGVGNNYVRLFDFIDSMNIYNEGKIIEYFKSEKFIRQISVAKNYLYNAILKSLKSYKQSSIKRDEVKDMLEDVSVLYDKRLFTQAKKILRKCKKICEGYEFYSELLLVLIWEIKIVVLEREYDEKTDKIINENYDKRNKILKIIDNMNEYDRLDYNMVSQITQHGDRLTKVSTGKLKTVLSSPLLNSENNALSTTAKLKYFHIHAAYCYAAGEYEKSWEYLNREVRLIKSTEEMFEQRMQDYFILLTNLLLLSIELGKFIEFETGLTEIRQQLKHPKAAKDERQKFYVLTRSSLLEMIYFNTKGEFDKSLQANLELVGKLIESGKTLSKADEYIRNNLISQAYFGVGDFIKALDSLNKILNESEAEQKYGSYHLAKLYSLIIHYELGNYDLLEYLIKSAYRYFLQKNSMHKFELLIFDFLKSLTDVNSQKEMIEKFRELKFRLEKISHRSEVKDPLKYFDLLSWLSGKIQNIPFAEAVKLKISAM